MGNHGDDDELGDLIACGTNHEGLGFLQDGETVDIEIQNIGKMTLKVRDPLKRTWEKGVYMGLDSTNPDAVKRHRPQGGATRGSDLTLSLDRRDNRLRPSRRA